MPTITTKRLAWSMILINKKRNVGNDNGKNYSKNKNGDHNWKISFFFTNEIKCMARHFDNFLLAPTLHINCLKSFDSLLFVFKIHAKSSQEIAMNIIQAKMQYRRPT